MPAGGGRSFPIHGGVLDLIDYSLTHRAMADTIVTTSGENSSAAGWVLAIVVIAAVLFAGLYLVRRANPSVPNTGTVNTNVTVPVPTGGASGGTSPAGGGTGTAQ